MSRDRWLALIGMLALAGGLSACSASSQQACLNPQPEPPGAMDNDPCTYPVGSSGAGGRAGAAGSAGAGTGGSGGVGGRAGGAGAGGASGAMDAGRPSDAGSNTDVSVPPVDAGAGGAGGGSGGTAGTGGTAGKAGGGGTGGGVFDASSDSPPTNLDSGPQDAGAPPSDGAGADDAADVSDGDAPTDARGGG